MILNFLIVLLLFVNGLSSDTNCNVDSYKVAEIDSVKNFNSGNTIYRLLSIHVAQKDKDITFNNCPRSKYGGLNTLIFPNQYIGNNILSVFNSQGLLPNYSTIKYGLLFCFAVYSIT